MRLIMRWLLTISSYTLILLLLLATVSPEEVCEVDGKHKSRPSSAADENDVVSEKTRPESSAAATSDDKSNRKPNSSKPTWKTGTLTPQQLPGPVVFSSFHTRNETFNLPGGRRVTVSEGSATQINKLGEAINVEANVSLLHQAASRESVNAMLDLLRAYDSYDEDPDTVDGMPTYEMFIDNDNLRAAAAAAAAAASAGASSSEDQSVGAKVLDSDPKALEKRIPLREKLKAITQPVLDDIITPFVRARYPEICNKTSHSSSTSSSSHDDNDDSRLCTPCYSLIRRYRHGERRSHAPHYDGHAICTVVVSLSDYGNEYRGGLFVGTGYGGQREYLAMSKGDAVLHRSTLLHGVQVYDLQDRPQDTERWSWILWYRDSTNCQDYSHEWFAECARDGDALCQQLHSTKVGNIPGLTSEEIATQIMDLNMRAAEGGAGTAAAKVARAYLKQLPSALPFDPQQAMRYYQMAIDSNNPEGHYGMASLLLASAFLAEQKADGSGSGSDVQGRNKAKVDRAVRHLEEAAMAGHVYSMFNLGIAHTFGYGTPNSKIDTHLAAEWLVASGLPEGYFVASHQAASVGDLKRQRLYEEQAKILGYHHVWRKAARQQTGSGGAGGVDLNLQWPTSPRGVRPPQF